MADIAAPSDVTKVVEGKQVKEIKSPTLTLGNLGSKLSKEIKDQMINQKNLLSVAPNSGVYGPMMGEAGVDDYGNYKILTNSAEGGTSKTAIEKLYKIIDQEGLLNTDLFTADNDNIGSKMPELNTQDMSLMLGSCPVINPPWQFGELDDVRSNRSFPLIGRVYLNYIYTNYPIVAFEPGREHFSFNPLDFIGISPFGDHKKLNN